MRSVVETYKSGGPTVAAESGSIGRLLAIPRVRAVAIASALARMPLAMGGVGLVLFVHSRPLVFAAAAGLGGTAWFVVRPEIAGIPPSPHGRGSRIGALASPAIRLLVVAGIPIGFTFGALDVAFPAFGADHGSAAIGGLLTA